MIVVNALPSVSRQQLSANMRYAIGMKTLRIALLITVSVVVALIVPVSYDFHFFYNASRDVLTGINPYLRDGFYSPISVPIMYLPLALLRVDVAEHINMAIMVGAYLIAVDRIFKSRLKWLILLSPLSILITRYGNLESLLLLGVVMPVQYGAWLLIMKPHLGVFAAAITIIKHRAWKTAAAIVLMLGVSVLMGMGQSTPMQASQNVGLFPYGLIVGLPLLWYAWRNRDEVTALSAAVFVTPYLNLISAVVALPLFRKDWRAMALGLGISWVIFLLMAR